MTARPSSPAAPRRAAIVSALAMRALAIRALAMHALAMRAVTVLGLTVLGLTVLVASACGDGSGMAPRPADSMLPDSAEMVAYGVQVRLTTASVAKGNLLADRSYSYDNGNRLELDRINVTFFDGTGAEDGTLTAREGTYNKRLNRLEARGDVVVVHEDGRRLETQQLVYDELRNQIFSDSAFVLNEPPKRQISGVGFESDPQLTTLRVLRQAKGVAPVTMETP
jgi:LPS export ABC transporter protein LptC